MGYQIKLKFIITQHSRDSQLMSSLVQYLNCGGYYNKTSQMGYFAVTDFSDIDTKIIPFFEKYSLHGAKALDFADFQRVADIIKVKGHLTEDGLDKIRLIKAEMNRGRQT